MTFPILDGFRVTYNGSISKNGTVTVALLDSDVWLRRLAIAGQDGRIVRVKHIDWLGAETHMLEYNLGDEGLIDTPGWEMEVLDRLILFAPKKTNVEFTAVLERRTE